MSFMWCFRSDGKGILDPKDPAITKGLGSGSRIRFGPFDVNWSSNSNGWGWIYYKHFPGDSIAPTSPRICITDLRVLDNVDAADAKWTYKGSPSDPGS
jgi:hypothetical protein